MQLWWRLWSLLASAEVLVLLCRGDYSRNQTTPEEQLSVIFSLFSWLFGASQSPAGTFRLAVVAGCVDKYLHIEQAEQEGLCISPFRLVWTCNVLPSLPRCVLLCFSKVGYGIAFGFVFRRVNKTEGQKPAP